MYHYFKIRYSVLLLRKRADARLDLRPAATCSGPARNPSCNVDSFCRGSRMPLSPWGPTHCSHWWESSDHGGYPKRRFKRFSKRLEVVASARPSSCAELVLQAADYSPGKVPVLFCPYSERKKIQLETIKFANLVCTCSSIPVLKSRYRYWFRDQDRVRIGYIRCSRVISG